MEDSKFILSQNWNWGPLYLLLQSWLVNFDSLRESHNVQKIWAILPRVSLGHMEGKNFGSHWKQVENFREP